MNLRSAPPGLFNILVANKDAFANRRLGGACVALG
jgi:hypothetical protein